MINVCAICLIGISRTRPLLNCSNCVTTLRSLSFQRKISGETYLFTHEQNKPLYKTAIDVRFIVENLDLFKRSIKARKIDNIDIDQLKLLYNDLRLWNSKETEVILKLDDIDRKRLSVADDELEKLKLLARIYKDKVVSLEKEIHEIVASVPNLLDHDTTQDSGLKVLETRKVEGLPVENVQKLKEHDNLAGYLNILRQPTSGYVTNSKGFFLTGAGCYLERALIRFTEDFLTNKGSFIPMTVPLLLTPKIIEGCGQIVSGERSPVYTLSDDFNYMNDPICLAGTSEHSLVGYLMRASIQPASLPLRLTATSPCFRAELTMGRHSRGIFRVPQFNKVEMVGVAKDSITGELLFDEFVSIQKELFDAIQIPYRVIEVPADDLGAPAYRKIDIEAYLPGRKEWGEISSCSNCTNFQSQRLHITSQSEFVHTVNGTACATPRMIIAILENYQRKDKSIQIPRVLQQYMPEFCRDQISAEQPGKIDKLQGLKFSKLSFKKKPHYIRKHGFD